MPSKFIMPFECKVVHECENSRCWIHQVVVQKRAVWAVAVMNGEPFLTEDWIEPVLVARASPPMAGYIGCESFLPENKKEFT